MIGFGNRIRELRINKGLTQKQVSEQIGISKAMISNYELDIREPSLTLLMKFASIFHVSSDYLLGLVKKPDISVDGLSDKQIHIVYEIIQSYRESS
jgi:transcriptional regulator with XRE-family HTH domain